jgi:glycosyltransferase involved in cell wall biosynthesis
VRVGVDLRALQIGHQYRGVGEVVKRTLDEMFQLAVDDGTSFVFYAYDSPESPTKLLQIPDDLQFKTILLGTAPLAKSRTKREKLVDALGYLYGNPIKTAKECDVFLQYDYALGVPTGTRTVLIKHDIIPFVFWDQFFESPMVPFKNKAARTTLRTIYHNYRSKRALTRSLRRATRIVTVSEHTRQDIHQRFGTPLKKMQTIQLGVSTRAAKNVASLSNEILPDKPFLLFIGGIDKRRRRVDDLVAAYNNLKADGHDIQLVLVGENFQSVNSIPEGPVRTAVKKSSYKSDILTLGYIDDATKQYLFQNAIAFVFPSMYEGFGLPVLEAMSLGCPVIAYHNSSIPEVGGDFALYASNWTDIQQQVQRLLAMPDKERQTFVDQAHGRSLQFSWAKTASQLYAVIKSTKR